VAQGFVIQILSCRPTNSFIALEESQDTDSGHEKSLASL